VTALAAAGRKRGGAGARARGSALALLILLEPGAPAAASPDEGRALFEERCAQCHGGDGRGGPARESLGVEPPDFSDCGFASREADADWFAVVHEGGPVRAFHALMPAHGPALSDEQIQEVIAHLRSFCTDARWPRGELNLPRPLVTEKAFPEDEVVLEGFVRTHRDGAATLRLVGEKRIGPRGQLELFVPIEAAEEPDPSSHWNVGVGDVAVGAKYAFFHRLEWGSIASLGGEVALPTGDDDEDLGSGSVVYEPYLAVGQILPGGSFAQLQLLGEIPADRDLADEIQLRTALGTSFTPRPFGRVISPILELIGTWSFLDGDTVGEWDLVPQVQIPLNRRQHVRLDVGVRIPLDDSARRPTQVGFYLLWDWFDGGLLDGW
jgi:mono/diheme cytochrome c family protein